MFESVITTLLNKYLAKYVANMDTEQLKVSMFSGEVVLKNLQLRTGALDELDLPISVVSGHVGELKLKVPWKDLFSKPVVAEVDNVFLLCVPELSVKPVDPEREKAKAADRKKKLIEDYEAAKLAKVKEKMTAALAKQGGGTSSDSSKQSFTEALITKIVNNVQIKVNRVHIRYEDRAADSQSMTYALGITLRGLILHSVDSEWKLSFVEENPSVTRKIMLLDALAVYWHIERDFPMLGHLSDAEISKALALPFVETEARETVVAQNPDYILAPIEAKLRLTLNLVPAEDMSIPKVHAQFHMRAVTLQLTDRQYRGALLTADLFARLLRSHKYRIWNPRAKQDGGGVLITPMQYPHRYWAFAIEATRFAIRERSKVFRWPNILKAIEQRRAYCLIYGVYSRLLQSTGKSDKAKLEELRKAEEALTGDQVVLYRQQVDEQIEREHITTKRETSAAKPAAKSGWFSGWFSSSASKPESEANLPFVNTTGAQLQPTDSAEALKSMLGLSDSDYRTFEQGIGFDPQSVVDTTGFPKDYVSLVVNAHFAAFRLRLTRHEDQSDVLMLTVMDLVANVRQLPKAESLVVDMTLRSIGVLGQGHTNTSPVQLLRVLHDKPPEKNVSGSGSSTLSSPAASPAPPADDSQVLTFNFTKNPMNLQADIAVQLLFAPTEILVDKYALEAVARFFVIRERLHVEELTTAVVSSVETLKDRTALDLAAALEQHMAIALDIMLYAPRIVVPQVLAPSLDHTAAVDAESTQAMVIVDLGSLHVTSVLAKKETEEVGDLDQIARLQHFAYDTYNVDFSSAQVILVWGEPVRNLTWHDICHSEVKTQWHLLHRFNIHIQVRQCIDADLVHLTQTMISGELPSLEVSISDGQVHKLMTIIKSLTAKSEQESAAQDASLQPLPSASPSPPRQHRSTDLTKQAVAKTAQELRTSEENVTNADVDELSEETDEEFYSADEGNVVDARVAARVQRQVRKLVELEFKVGVIALVLSKSHTAADVPLIEIALRNTSIKLAQSSREMSLTLALGAFTVTDRMYRHSNAYMISAGAVEPFSLRSKQRDDESDAVVSEAEHEAEEAASVPGQSLLHVQMNVTKMNIRPKMPPANHTQIQATLGSIFITAQQRSTAQLIDWITSDLARAATGKTDAELEAEEALAAATQEDADDEEDKNEEDLGLLVHADSDASSADATKARKEAQEMAPAPITANRLSLTVSFSALQLDLAQQATVIARLQLADLHASMSQNSEHMEVSLSLKSFTLLNPSENVAAHLSRIIYVDGEEAMTVHFLKCMAMDDVSKAGREHEMAVKMRGARVVICVARRFLESLAEYGASFTHHLNKLKGSRDLSAEATAATKLAAVDVAASSNRVSLDVILLAPTIICPLKNSDHDQLNIDLGQIIVANKFIVRKSETAPEALFFAENMTVTLGGLQIYVLNENAKSTILQEFDLVIRVDRNLFNRDLFQADLADPSVSVRVALSRLNLSITKPDMALLMALKHDFMQAGKPLTVEDSANGASELRKSSSSFSSSRGRRQSVASHASASSRGSRGSETGATATGDPLPPPYIAVSVLAGFDGVCIRIAESAAEPLTALLLSAVSVTATIASDGLTLASASIAALEVEDSRPQCGSRFRRIVFHNDEVTGDKASQQRQTSSVSRTEPIIAAFTQEAARSVSLGQSGAIPSSAAQIAARARQERGDSRVRTDTGSSAISDVYVDASEDANNDQPDTSTNLVTMRLVANKTATSIFLSVFKLRTSVYGDYIASLLQFFASLPVLEPKEMEKPEDTSGQVKREPSSDSGLTRGRASSTRSNYSRTSRASRDARALKASAPSFKLQVVLDDPEFILIANHKDKNSHALKAALDLSFTYSQANMQSNIDLQAFKLCLVSCNLASRQFTETSVLQPCGVHVWSQMVPGPSKVGLLMNDVNIRISYLDLKTALLVLRSITEPLAAIKKEVAQQKTLTDELTPLQGGYYDCVQALLSNQWYLQDVEEEGSDSGVGEDMDVTADATETELPPSQHRVTIQISDLSIRIIDDCGDNAVPLLALLASVVANGSDDATGMMIESSLSLRAMSYNDYVDTWVPLIEPVRSEQGELLPWTMGVQIHVPKPGHKGPTQVRVEAEHRFELTLAQRPMANIIHALSAWPADLNKAEASEMPILSRTKFTPYVLQNRTGHVVTIRIPYVDDNPAGGSSTSGISATNVTGSFQPPKRQQSLASRLTAGGTLRYREIKVAPNTEHRIEVDTRQSDFIDWRQVTVSKPDDTASKSILVVEGWTEMQPVVPLTRTGHYVRHVQPVDGGRNPPVRICVDVAQERGSKVITIRSGLRFVNSTNLPLDVGYETPASKRPIFLATVAPAESFSVPLLVAYYGRLRFKPAGHAYTWSHESFSWVKSEENPARSLHCEYQSSPSVPAAFDLDRHVGRSNTLPAGPEISVAEASGRRMSLRMSGSVSQTMPSVRSGTALNKLNDLLQREPSSVNHLSGISAAVTAAPAVVHPFMLRLHVHAGKGAHIYPNANFPHPGHTFTVYAPLTLTNLLPFAIRYAITDVNNDSKRAEGKAELPPGESLSLYDCDLEHELHLSVLLNGYEWSSGANLQGSGSLQCLSSSGGASLGLAMVNEAHVGRAGARTVSIYAPYLVVNKLSLPLTLCDSANQSQTQRGLREGAINFFSFGDGMSMLRVLSHTVCLRAPASQMSEPFTIDTLGQAGVVSINDVSPDVLNSSLMELSRAENSSAAKRARAGLRVVTDAHVKVELAVDIEQAENRYSKVVTIRPHFVIRNKTGRLIHLCNAADEKYNIAGWSVGPDETAPHLMSDQMRVRFTETAWTAPFRITDPGTIYLKARIIDDTALGDSKGKEPATLEDASTISSSMRRGVVVIVMEVALDKSMVVLTFRLDSGVAPILVENRCVERTITFAQADAEEHPNAVLHRVPPQSCMPWVLDSPTGANGIMWYSEDVRGMEKQFAELGGFLVGASRDMTEEASASSNAAEGIFLVVFPEGTSCRVVFSDTPIIASRIERLFGLGSSLAQYQRRSVCVEEEMFFDLCLHLDGFGVSMIVEENQVPFEFCYVCLKELAVELTTSDKSTGLYLTLGNLQIDNQQRDAQFPCAFARAPLPESAPKEAKDLKFIDLKVVKSNQEASATVDIYQFVSFLMQRAELKLDDRFLILTSNFVTSILGEKKKPNMGVIFAAEQERLVAKLQVSEKANSEKRLIFLYLLEFHPIAINITFSLSDFQADENKTLSLDSPVRILLTSIGGSLTNIHDAPLEMHALVLTRVLVTQDSLIERIGGFYKDRVLGGLYKILGSVDLLGNPVGIINSIGTGVFDLFYEPYQATMKDPKKLGIGLAKGGKSLAANTVGGVTDSLSRFVGSLGKGVAVLTMDAEYQQQRTKDLRSAPQTLAGGVTAGGKRLLHGFADGVTGIIMKPIEGAQAGGAAGFFVGIGRGLVGAVAKPIGGVLDMAAETFHGVSSMIREHIELVRVRPPRVIPVNNVVSVYNLHESIGAMFLFQMENCKFSADKYVAHVELQGKGGKIIWVYFTNLHLLILMGESRNKLALVYEFAIQDVNIVVDVKKGLIVHFPKPKSGPSSIPLPATAPPLRDWMMTKFIEAKSSLDEE